MALLNLNHSTPADGVELNASDLETWYHRKPFSIPDLPHVFSFLYSILDHWLVVSFFFVICFFPTTASNFVFFRPHPLVNWLIWVTSSQVRVSVFNLSFLLCAALASFALHFLI